MSNRSIEIGGIDVSRETQDKLHKLSVLIVKWTKSINLIAPASVNEIWDRHIIDSAQVYKYAGNSWRQWIDLGSGGGLPGLVISILNEGAQVVTLVESDTRKCLFLNTVRRELDLNIIVLNQRIEAINVTPADILSARALSSLPNLLVYADRLLHPDGIALFSKGAKFQEELDLARRHWHFDCMMHQSLTNADARILEISRISRREH